MSGNMQKEQFSNFSVWISSAGVGVVDVTLRGFKKLGMPLETLKNQTFGGKGRDFGWELPEELEKNICV